MKYLFNNKKLIKHRRILRTNSTEPEIILWNQLRNKKFHNTKFKRQYSVGLYVLDFYCPRYRLAIELDGRHHESKNTKKYDKERTKQLDEVGIKVLRFRNEKVVNNLGRILEIIESYLTPFYSPSPKLGEGAGGRG
ncbi:endonuclease domain-containing protein, partial [bacterium]|nr:endonuclease domain-containing protein [bacterium]